MTEPNVEPVRVSRHAARLSWAGLLIAVAMLSGCSFIPDYERPAAPVPQQFAETAESTSTPAPPDWRTYFPDPALHTLIEAALANNRDLRIALARVEEARALAGVARADRFPTLEAQGSANRSDPYASRP